MLAHRRDRREQDGRGRRRDRHVHDVFRRESLPREDEREQRDHRHPAAKSEQAREKTDDRAQGEERDDQHRVHHLTARPAVPGTLTAPLEGGRAR